MTVTESNVPFATTYTTITRDSKHTYSTKTVATNTLTYKALITPHADLKYGIKLRAVMNRYELSKQTES